MFILLLALIGCTNAFFDSIDGFRPFGVGYNRGAYPEDVNIVGTRALEAVHDSQDAPTGLAVDHAHNIYLTYPRNMGPTPNNVVIATSFNGEKAWPNASIQHCGHGQDP